MSVVTWVTPRGNLGTVPESEFYSFNFLATDSDEQSLFYSFISGELPTGLYITPAGQMRGIPTLLKTVSQIATFSFTIRATNPNGTVADRSFSLSITNVNGPQIIPRPSLVGSWFDGTYLEYQFESINDNPVASETWSVISGDLPPGVSISPTGLLSGYVAIIAKNITELGFEAGPNDAVVYDSQPLSQDRYYNFTIQVTDGARFDTVNVQVLIVSKGSFTADNAITLINNSFITIDISADDKYRPIILNAPESLPILVSGSTFAYKFVAYDPEDEDISWTIDELATSGMDELDAALFEVLNGNGTNTVAMTIAPASASRIVVFVNDVRLVAGTDYSTAGTSLIFATLTPITGDLILVQYISTTTGFDSLLFDQGATALPAGLSINQDTGWVIGTLPQQVADLVTYEFNVLAYRTLYPSQQSLPITFSLTVRRSLNEEILWTSPTDLGTIDNGAVSEIQISAYNTLGKELEYAVVYEPSKRTPQGLKFLRSGRFTGRVTFRYFSLDGQQAVLNVTSTENLVVGMSIQGVGVSAGCTITAIVNDTTIEVQPAIYVTQGTILTFTNIQTSVAVSTISNAISTAIDGGATTFDQQCGFTVRAISIDGSISDTKSFTIRVTPRNLAPYENVYLKALPSPDQRLSLRNVLNNTDIFPTSLLYRYDDPYFGLQKNLKFIFLPGLHPASASTFVNTIAQNHYFKSINFGDVKTARAVDENGNVTYEVVYVDVVDTQTYATDGPPLSVALGNQNNFIYDGQSYSIIYPNSFINMQNRLEQGIGYTNRGTIPAWMTSVQENGRVLGLIRAVVLAYTQPGASNLIAYRLAASGFKINSIAFVSDRYQWDNYLSQYFNLETNTFLESRATTFDKYPKLEGTDIVETTITNAVADTNVIQIPDTIAIGTGWTLLSYDPSFSVPFGTTISSVAGNVLTLTNNITCDAGVSVKIDGTASVDYSVFASFNSINGQLVSEVIRNGAIDGITNFIQGDTIIFARQRGFSEPINDGWVDTDGTTFIPGYLEKLSGTATVNQRGGVWRLNWVDLPGLGFDDNLAGFDQAQPGFSRSYFDQTNDGEINLEFVSEVLLRQTVKVRTGTTYTQTTLQYVTVPGEVVPYYIPYVSATGTDRTAETTFDGGSCVMRIGANTQSAAAGTTFVSNRDKYIIPESLDKYIKFPQTGVFV